MSAHFIMTCGDAKWLQLGVLTGLCGGADQAAECILHGRRKQKIRGEMDKRGSGNGGMERH